MKRFTTALSIVLSVLLLIALPAEAQHRPHHGQQQRQNPQSMMGQGMMGQGMMGQGMMHRMHQQMMQSPMHRAHMMTFMLPALADTLELSEKQTAQIKELNSEAMGQHKAHRQQMMTHRQELMGLFEGDAQPSTDAVREHMMAMAEMRANQQVALYETGQQMRQVLTDEQRQMLDDMAPQQMMQQMMSNMTMMDMMQMMRSMHGGQMSGGMMQGGMMQGGMMMQRMQNRPMRQNRQNQ